MAHSLRPCILERAQASMILPAVHGLRGPRLGHAVRVPGCTRRHLPNWLQQHRLRVQAQVFWGSRSEGLDVSCSKSDEECLYSLALDLARQENYEGARDAFEVLLMHNPRLCKAWVSYAQVMDLLEHLPFAAGFLLAVVN